VLSQPLREINVEALPLEVPEHIDLDVSHMGVGDTLRMSDIVVPQGITLLDDLETVVATVTAPTREVEPEPVEGEEGEVPEGEAAEGEAAAGEEGAEEPAEGETQARSAEPGTVEG
jgi:large subunit ribosomal protein L25